MRQFKPLNSHFKKDHLFYWTLILTCWLNYGLLLSFFPSFSLLAVDNIFVFLIVRPQQFTDDLFKYLRLRLNLYVALALADDVDVDMISNTNILWSFRRVICQPQQSGPDGHAMHAQRVLWGNMRFRREKCDLHRSWSYCFGSSWKLL